MVAEEAIEEERVAAGNEPPVPMLLTKERKDSKRRAKIRQQTKHRTQTRKRKAGKEVEVSLASVTIR